MAALSSPTPALLLSTSLLLLQQVQISQPCLCSILRNFKCPSAPACCESGQYTLDECGCCQKCAKAELQKCGGASDISGKCAGGLQCLKTCLPCKTVGDTGRPCIFPFKYADNTYDKCTSKDSDNGQPWCATEVDDEGYVVDNAWGDCLEGCPGSRLECDDKYFSIQEGKCIDISVPGAIPNWFGAPAVKLESPTRDLFQAPACKNKKGTVRFYDNTCRCVRGESAIDLSSNGQIRGNCTGLEDDNTDNLDKVWCFLENIRDPLNPSSGCYSDTKWSERDGRFWSSLACFQAPDIEGGEKATIGRGFSNRVDKPYRPTTRRPPTRPPTTRRATTTAVRTTTTAIAIGEIEQYTDGEEHFYFSEYYQDYQEENDIKISDTEGLSDYEYNNQDDLYNNDLAKPTKLDDKSFTFVVGETNLPGFGREDETPQVLTTTTTTTSTTTTTTTTTTQEPPPTRQIGPFLPTPSPIITTTTSNRRNLLRNRFKNRNRSRRPPNANPRRKPSTPRTNKRVLATRFPNFRRRPQILRRTTERPRPPTTNDARTVDDLGKIPESPRSFLEGEFGENNIPIAIPLFENGELSDDIFKKIKIPLNKGAKKIPVPPIPPFGSVLAKVETETVKVDKAKKKKSPNLLNKISKERVTQKPQQEIENGLLDLFGDIDVGLNEVKSETSNNVGFNKAKSIKEIDVELNEVKPSGPIDVEFHPVKPEATIDVELNEIEPHIEFDVGVNEVNPQAIVALPFILEENSDLIDDDLKTTVPSVKPITAAKEPTQAGTQELIMTKADLIISLDDPITTIPNVFKYLPTLSTGRRNGPASRTVNKEPDIPHTINEDGPETSQPESNTEQKVDKELDLVELEDITAELPNLTDIATNQVTEKFTPAMMNIKTPKKKTPRDISYEEPIMHKKAETQENAASSKKAQVVVSTERTSTSISISETVEKRIKTVGSDNIVNDNGGSGSVGSDTALLSESLKNIVRVGITNQDNVDKKAISEELKNIVRSGILDLGILGLWNKDPIVPANTSPMPVFRPASVRQVN